MALTFSWTSNGKNLLLFEITPKETVGAAGPGT
jgi:hypothetical protein